MQSAPLSRHWPTLILGTTALAAVALAATAARGQENTSTTILVTASVEAACSLQTDQIAIDFGVYNDVDIVRDASFTYNCPRAKVSPSRSVVARGWRPAGFGRFPTGLVAVMRSATRFWIQTITHGSMATTFRQLREEVIN